MNKKQPMDFEQIYLNYFSKMKYFAQEYVVSDQDAENIVQDVFMELWENKYLLSEHTNLVAFLFTAIKNRSLNFLRHKMIVQEAASHLQEEYMITLQMNLNSLEAFDQAVFSDRDIEQLVNHAIHSLPEKCRQIFIMSKIEGKKQKEIAAELNISFNTVENQMNIAYKKLKTELKGYMPLLAFLLSL
ncbi:MAG: RNA polymerase sigma-70 factor [Tannerellaceae bacterium]